MAPKIPRIEVVSSLDVGPFAKHIMATCLPPKSELRTTLTPYDDTGDPALHLTVFQTVMYYHRATNFALRRAFPIFLGKATLLWFSSLLSGSINSFDDLSQAFLRRFTTSRVYHKTGAALHYIRQGQLEPLREYLNKYHAKASDIPSLDPQIELFCIQHGLKPETFADQIALVEPKDDRFHKDGRSKRGKEDWLEKSQSRDQRQKAQKGR
ncbi:hypothetical protein Cni_G19489 [Canna indica]|uniref:Retrotransposon gag domain-containing protein n=1 Tax=Canna indica TaxID=4628 RepID=A0AAQ3KME1_9LILI|nr:hypothetical protein Cni_G19489 [Canna indica]